MKFTKKIILNFVFSILILFILIQFLGRLVRPLDIDNSFNTINTFRSLPKNSLEVITFGSSRMWRGINVMEMYDKYGIGAYNYGNNWQQINTTLLFIKESLKTQSPKVIIIDTYHVGNVLENSDLVPEIYYTKALPSSKNKREYLKQCFGNKKESYISYYFPLYAFHSNWVNIKKESFKSNSDKNDFYKSMGYWNIDGTYKAKLKSYSSFPQYSLSDSSLKVLDEIVEVCKKNDVKIIFITLPSEESFHFYGNAMKNYANEKGYVYFNFYEMIDELNIDVNNDFNDHSHFNDNGAKKVSNFLGKYIKENYDVTDMRTIDNNIWQNQKNTND